MTSNPPHKKARLLLIFPGPIFFPDAFLKVRMELLSRSYSGAVVSSSGMKTSAKYGQFDVHLSKFESQRKLFTEIQLWLLCFKIARTAKKSGEPLELIISYDPLRTGLLSWILSRIYSTKLLVEVNGVYQSDKLHFGMSKLKRWYKKKTFTELERFVLKRTDGIKGLFKEQLDTFQKEVEQKNKAFFFDYVNTKIFSTGPSENCILFIGHPLYIKGVDLLLEAFERIHPKFPDWRLKILGWFEGAEQAILHEACNRNPHIQLHPPVPNAEIPKHMASCAFLVLPSRTEAMGRVLIEAMAAGKPRIGANIDGIPTVIRHGHDGLLFRPESVDDLCIQMERLIGDQQLRETLGENALLRCKREFSDDRYFELCNNLYEQVLKS